MSKKAMSKSMYDFLQDNKHRVDIDESNGIVTTSRGNTGTVCSTRGYLRMRLGEKTIQVHQLLAVCYFGEECIGKVVNHSDGNKLNNKKENLEIVSNVENIQHAWKTGLNSNALESSRNQKNIYNGKYLKGVLKIDKPGNKIWRSYCRRDNKTVVFGYYETMEEAGRVHDKKVREIYGQDAVTNEDLGLL